VCSLDEEEEGEDPSSNCDLVIKDEEGEEDILECVVSDEDDVEGWERPLPDWEEETEEEEVGWKYLVSLERPCKIGREGGERISERSSHLLGEA